MKSPNVPANPPANIGQGVATRRKAEYPAPVNTPAVQTLYCARMHWVSFSFLSSSGSEAMLYLLHSSPLLSREPNYPRAAAITSVLYPSATSSGNVVVSGSSQDDEGESDEDGKMLQDGSARVVGGERVGREWRGRRGQRTPQSVINGILSAYGFLEIIQLVDYLRSNGSRSDSQKERAMKKGFFQCLPSTPQALLTPQAHCAECLSVDTISFSFRQRHSPLYETSLRSSVWR
ncbi:hypothetical protein THAOC_25307, partial [Thalassiosira oceanica]